MGIGKYKLYYRETITSVLLPQNIFCRSRIVLGRLTKGKSIVLSIIFHGLKRVTEYLCKPLCTHFINIEFTKNHPLLRILNINADGYIMEAR
jgi:hypothetical protein